MERYLVRCKRWVNSHIQENCRWQDSRYLPDVTVRHVAEWGLKGFLCQLVLCYFFYQSWIAVIILLPVTGVLVFLQWQGWRRKILLTLERGFKEWLYYIKGGLTAGKSVEQAILSCRNDFSAHMGRKHPILLGMEQFYRNMFLHIPIDECMRNFGTETGVEVIRDFSVIFEIAQKQGGHMVSTLEKSIQHIYERVELRQEIQAMIAAKQLEQGIMCTMPFAILFFVGKASGGYFASLYHNVQGVCIMTGCMSVYIASVWWGRRLTDIRL